MKSVLITLCLVSMLLLPLVIYAQKPAAGDAILGVWFNAEKDAKIEIYKAGKFYNGKVIWLRNPLDANGKPKTDIENPDPQLRSRSRLNLIVLTNLAHKTGIKYEKGKIYDPKAGKTYSCQAELNGNDKLNLRGYIGVSLVGKTSEWTRTK